MIVGGTTPAARVKPSDERGDISYEAIAGSWNWCGGMNDGGGGDGGDAWSGGDNRYIVMMHL